MSQKLLQEQSSFISPRNIKSFHKVSNLTTEDRYVKLIVCHLID